MLMNINFHFTRLVINAIIAAVKANENISKHIVNIHLVSLLEVLLLYIKDA